MDQSVPLVQFVNRPGIIDLAWGHPNPDLLPVEGLRNTSGARLWTLWCGRPQIRLRCRSGST